MNTNLFAALDKKHRRTKSKGGKSDKGIDSKSKSNQQKAGGHAVEEAPLSAGEAAAIFESGNNRVSNWADDDSDEEFSPESFGLSDSSRPAGQGNDDSAQQGDSLDNSGAEDEEDEEEMDSDQYEEDIDGTNGMLIEDNNDDSEDERDQEDDAGDSAATTTTTASSAGPAQKQLSKKELKEKEMADLDAVFAEMGIEVKGSSESPANQDQAAKGESKSAAARRRKKANKAKQQQQPEQEAPPVEETAEEEETSGEGIDKDAALAKLQSAKKKKGKGKAGGAAAAAKEAKARSKKTAKKGKGKMYFPPNP